MGYMVFLVCYSLQLKTAREAATFGAVGAAVGAVSTAGCAWKWSRSPHGMLSFCVRVRVHVHVHEHFYH